VEGGLLPADRWTPPPSLKPFVGEKPAARVDGVPLTDAQILQLLEGLPRDPAGERWRFCLQLIAAHGLRPVEVQHLRLEATGQLWCDYCKRSGGGSTRPRRLRPLHPEWATEWHLLERVAAGEPLPPFGGGVADAARRYLHRQPAWAPLAAAGATAYSFRHGYALRAHQSYGLSPRVTAALMGHSPETHQRHYSRWTDEATVDAALEQAIRYRNLTQSAEPV
jgi:integrase